MDVRFHTNGERPFADRRCRVAALPRMTEVALVSSPRMSLPNNEKKKPKNTKPAYADRRDLPLELRYSVEVFSRGEMWWWELRQVRANRRARRSHGYFPTVEEARQAGEAALESLLDAMKRHPAPSHRSRRLLCRKDQQTGECPE